MNDKLTIAKLFSWSLFLFFITSCNEHPHKVRINGIEDLKSFQFSVAIDTQSNEVLYKQFSRNDTLFLESYYLAGLKDGIEKKYHLNGQIEYLGRYKQGEEDSIWTWYYDNGNVESYGFWHSGMPWGDKIGWFLTGELEYIVYYDLFGHAIFLREYNQQGGLIHSEGVPVQVIVNKYELNKNEYFEIKILTSAYEAFKNAFVVYLIHEDSGEIEILAKDMSIESLVEWEFSKIEILRKKMTHEGKYTVYVQGVIYDTIIKDSILYEHNFGVNVGLSL